MTSTATPDSAVDEQPPSRRRRKRPKSRRRRVIFWSSLAVVLIALAIAGYWAYWLGTGLLDASRIVQDRAAVAQAELQAFRDTLKAGDDVTAEQHLATAEEALDEAFEASQVSQVRQAKGLPYVGSTVADLDYLLGAADIMTGSAQDALVVYRDFSGDDSELFSEGEFSIPAIRSAHESVLNIERDMDRAEAVLKKVTGEGPKGQEALAKKRSGLRQIASLRAELLPLEPVLRALPSAVGADGKRTYLVAIMNPAEMRASGGAPLSVAFIRFKDGKMKRGVSGRTSDITLPGLATFQGENPPAVWNRLKNDPFQPAPGTPQRFVNATFNPDFPVSAQQMLRATPTFFGVKTQGVIALDVVALSQLLAVTGPLETEGYGTLTSENLAETLLIDAYNPEQRAEKDALNAQLTDLMLSRLVEGGGMIGKAKALGQAVPARHLQMYFRDDRLQQLVEEKQLGGEVPDPEVGNLGAVYTQNGNASKMDVFQKRTVKDTVQLRKNGSAVVTRTVVLKNASPPQLPGFELRRRGYETRWATNLVINLLPDGSRVVGTPEGVLPATVKTGKDQKGRTFAQAAVVTPPDSTSKITWTYVVPDALEQVDGGWRFTTVTSPQSMFRVPKYRLSVLPPKGWSITNRGERWTLADGQATLSVPMDRPDMMRLLVSEG